MRFPEEEVSEMSERGMDLNGVLRGLLITAAALVAASCGGGGDTTAAVTAPPVTTTPPPVTSGPPTATSVSAATATATSNALCTAVAPFYWEIGDKTGVLASGSVGTPVIAATTVLPIASASKWLYGMYVMQQIGSAAISATALPFLNFTSGYTNMGDDTTASTCPDTDNPNTINTCLTLKNANGMAFNAQNPANVGMYYYDAGHLENYASLYGQLGNVDVTDLGPMIGAELATGVSLVYHQPLLAGGVYTSAGDYGTILRNMLAGNLVMIDVLGSGSVCTQPKTCATAAYSPIPEAWHYSIAHWIEDDPATNGDGAFSSPGAFGFYPWVEAAKVYYGVLSRAEPTGGGAEPGYSSAECGRLIRHAFDAGTQQTGAIPD